MLLDTVLHFTNQLTTEFKQSIKLVPVVWQKPRVFRHWLLNARTAQIALMALVIIVPFALNPLIDMLLANLFGTVTEERVFGLFTKEKVHPYLENAQLIAHWIIWILSLLICIYLFLRHLPDALEHAREVVEQKIQLADKLLKKNPSESILLYTAATQWNVDENYEKVLSTKLHGFNDSVFNDLDKTIAVTTQVNFSSAPQNFSHSVIAERYPIKKLLGSGAMGNVYLAEDIRLKREVALKQLAPNLSSNKQLIARFRQEAVALARLSHPNIVQVYDFFEAEGFFWIAMEFVTGGELEEKLQSGSLQLQETLRLVKQLAEALGYAHEKGVIHRDFKPANVLLTENADVKISDFGIAKLAQSSVHTQINTVMGTPSYMSPEQANGENADLRTDIYSLGVVTYQMLSGELPFKGDTKSIVAQHLTKQAPSLSEKHKDIPTEIDYIIQKMLMKAPADRYQSMLEIAEQIEAYLDKQIKA